MEGKRGEGQNGRNGSRITYTARHHCRFPRHGRTGDPASIPLIFLRIQDVIQDTTMTDSTSLGYRTPKQECLVGSTNQPGCSPSKTVKLSVQFQPATLTNQTVFSNRVMFS